MLPVKMCRLVLASVLLAIPFGAHVHAAETSASPPKPAPVDVYAALPGARSARLSPDGKLLALIAPYKGRNALVVWDLEHKGNTRVLPTDEFEPDWFVWKNDHRLLAGLSLFSLRDARRPVRDTRLIAVDADGRNGLNLVDAAQFRTYIPQTQDRIVGFLPKDPDHILLALPAVDRSGIQPGQTTSMVQVGSLENQVKYPEVVQVDINTGRLKTIARQRGTVIDWQADENGEVRIAHGLRGKQTEHQVRLADGSWRQIQSYEVNGGRTFRVLGFVPGKANELHVLSNHEGGPDFLYVLDAETGAFSRKVAGSGSNAVQPLSHNGRFIGYQLGQDGTPVYLDPDFAKDAAVIGKAMPGSRLRILDRSVDGKRTLCRIAEGNEPANVWLLDRSGAQPELIPVIDSYPDLAPEQLGRSRVTRYKARDGLDIPAILTFPPGHKAGNPPIPFVVLPHGGPTAHDSEGFDYLVQFLVSRGYGVLQPQFRGSSGYGPAFEKAGFRQWGLTMQDDVTDGTRWLVEQKLADPARIAIVGASYGGYAALMGAVKEPGLYKASVAIAPVTDLADWVESNWQFLFSDVNLPRIGSDSDQLERTSPASNVGRIQIPVLLIHGRKDYTVPVRQTERMASALEKAGKVHEVIYLPEGDHYLSHAEDRLTTLKALEGFLGKRL